MIRNVAASAVALPARAAVIKGSSAIITLLSMARKYESEGLDEAADQLRRAASAVESVALAN